MDNAYPYLVQHNKSGKFHLIEKRKILGKEQEVSACGHMRDNLNAHEDSKTIKDAVKERKLCKICLMHDDVYRILAEQIKEWDKLLDSTTRPVPDKDDTAVSS